jgi:hypothetical protein
MADTLPNDEEARCCGTCESRRHRECDPEALRADDVAEVPEFDGEVTTIEPKTFAVEVCIIRNKDGSRDVHQVPSFRLDAATHGLISEDDAQGFAETMIKALVNDKEAIVFAVAEEV